MKERIILSVKLFMSETGSFSNYSFHQVDALPLYYYLFSLNYGSLVPCENFLYLYRNKTFAQFYYEVIDINHCASCRCAARWSDLHVL